MLQYIGWSWHQAQICHDVELPQNEMIGAWCNPFSASIRCWSILYSPTCGSCCFFKLYQTFNEIKGGSGPYDLPVPSDCGRMKKYQILMHSLGLHCLDNHKWLKTVCYDTVLQAATRHFSFADYSIRSFGAVSRRIEECRISLSDGMIHDSGSLLVYWYFACIDLLFLCKCVSRNSQIQVSLVMRQITLVVGSWGTDTSLERLGCFILTYFFCVEILC